MVWASSVPSFDASWSPCSYMYINCCQYVNNTISFVSLSAYTCRTNESISHNKCTIFEVSNIKALNDHNDSGCIVHTNKTTTFLTFYRNAKYVHAVNFLYDDVIIQSLQWYMDHLFTQYRLVWLITSAYLSKTLT